MARQDFAHSSPHRWRQSGDLPGDIAVVHQDGRRAGDPRIGGRDRRAANAARIRARSHRPRREVDPGLGPRPALQHAREPSGLVYLPPARLGVPIPAVDCAKCGEAILTADLVERAAAWSSISTAPTRGTSGPSEFLTPGLTCPACGGTEFERERDILDVWFDSGSSHEAVLAVP